MLKPHQLTKLPQRKPLEIITGNLLIIEPTQHQGNPESCLITWCYFNLYLINNTQDTTLQGWRLNQVENYQLIGNFWSDCRPEGTLYFWSNLPDTIIQISGADSCPKIVLV
jgi:hypothetical protein